MSERVNRFYNRAVSVLGKPQSEAKLVELFVYFLTVEAGNQVATTPDIRACFVACDLGPGKNVSARLSEGTKSKPLRYIKCGPGYKLHRHTRERLVETVGADAAVVQTSSLLRSLEGKLADSSQRAFLKEAVDCFEVGADRAAIVLCWILAMDHLFSYIMNEKLPEFNAVLKKNTDKSIKVNEIKESKFIELCRQGKIISGDVRKILSQKLDIRNSCAHPSSVKVGRNKVIDFIEDLVENVVLKYQMRPEDH